MLAQVRFDERTGEGGRRVLFLEEIQSDWHEKGRREGYRNSAEVRRIGEALDEAERRAEDYASGDETAYTDTDDLIESPPAGERPAAAAFRLRSELAAAKAAVPQAPFASAWHELVFKRMLRWAAEHGYDQLAWTTGTQQAERYSLAEKVGRLDYDRNRGVLADSPVGAGERTAAVKPEQLADYVGKELARRLLDGTPDASGVVRLEGSDLKVGGAGMRGFYDKILPDFVRRYARQWGVDVKDAGVIGQKGARMTVHAVDITPAMRESVIKQGQPLFSFGPRGT
ncbi:MAG: hypothetical protein ACRDOE_26970, partial [Streptosporangiaceae bacterium]